MGSGHVSDRWTSFLNYHLHDSFIVFKKVQLRLTDILGLGFGIGPRTSFLNATTVGLDSVVGST